MTAILTSYTEIIARNAPFVFRLDSVIVLFLICLLFSKDIIRANNIQQLLLRPYIKYNSEKIHNIYIFPFFLIFCYVLIYRVLILINVIK